MIPLLNSMSWGSSKRCSRANISIFSGQHIALNFHIVCTLAMRAGHADFLVSSMSDGYKVAWGRTKDMRICLGLKVGWDEVRRAQGADLACGVHIVV